MWYLWKAPDRNLQALGKKPSSSPANLPPQHNDFQRMTKTKRHHKRGRRSAGPATADTRGICINGRCIIDATPGSSTLQVNLSPMSGGVNLGNYNARLASEADLWQEFRFTKLKIHYLPTETPGNRNQCTIVGVTNVVLNYAPASAADIISLPASNVFALGGAGTAYPTYPIAQRQAWSVPRRTLNPPLTKWLVCYNSSGQLNTQGSLWGYFNYTASTGPNVWMFVEWECEFRNPVPAGVTLVLNKGAPGYKAALVRALAEAKAKDEEKEWTDAGLQRELPKK